MLPRPKTALRAMLTVLGLAALPALIVAPLLPMPAWAQDDDDDDDDWDDDDSGYDGDDDDDDWPRGVVLPRASSSPRPAAAVVVLPDQADDQIVVEGLLAYGREQLLAQGFSVLEQSGDRLLLQVPDAVDVPAALAAVLRVAPTAPAAPNSYYRSQEVPTGCDGALCSHWEAVAWPPVSAVPMCRFEPHIGVIDTGVNVKHDMLAEARITLETIGSAGAEPSEHKHGTAVVAMFVGNPADRVPGLAPAAELLVVDPFGRVGSDERSDVFALVDALDRLAEAGVDIASLSLAGPDNPILAAAIERLQAAGIPVVAAVGNAGPRSGPLYPAAYPDVVAVTAIDGSDRVYRRAVQGEHVGFAAPGVGITTAASIAGVRPQTGTSFAVPFVTTALAAAMASGVPAAEAIERLEASSLDLGEPGRDSVFGWGRVQIPSPC